MVVSEDEHPRPDTTLETLQKLKPLFADGVTTAGNASGINDGAAALVVASRDAGDKAGVKPIARVLATARRRRAAAHHGVRAGAGRTRRRWSAPASTSRTWTSSRSTRRSLRKCWPASRASALPLDDTRVNPNGGAIAMGHPLGRVRRAPRADRGAPAAAHRRTLRAGLHVHRRRPGHRRHSGAGVGRLTPAPLRSSKVTSDLVCGVMSFQQFPPLADFTRYAFRAAMACLRTRA